MLNDRKMYNFSKDILFVVFRRYGVFEMKLKNNQRKAFLRLRSSLVACNISYVNLMDVDKKMLIFVEPEVAC